ncbi:hypothetical protein GCM10025781_18240 [Kocuria gwangalliensis]|uniref:Uncharacterized protein n=1 Tax=Kocuria gwangalliensis TaxID=501592 RepID=A0ABP8X4G0_9MICC
MPWAEKGLKWVVAGGVAVATCTAGASAMCADVGAAVAAGDSETTRPKDRAAVGSTKERKKRMGGMLSKGGMKL